MKLMILAIGFLSLFSTSPQSVAGNQKNGSFEIQNGLIKLELKERNGMYFEHYYAKKGDSWIALLESGNTRRPDPAMKQNGKLVSITFQKVEVKTQSNDEQTLLLNASSGAVTLQKAITIKKGESFARVQVSYTIESAVELEYLLSTYSFAPDGKNYSFYKPLDFIFTPQLRPAANHLIADHTFRSPALMMQKGKNFVALVPDIQTIDIKGRKIKSTGDLQVETSDKPFFSFGLQNWLPEPYQLKNTHVFYSSSDTLAVALHDTTVSFGFFLFLNANAEPQEGFHDVVRFHWQQSGEKNVQRARGPQAEPFANYIKKAWYEFLPQIALDAEYHGKSVTLLRQARLAWSNNLHKAADNDSWFNVWFNSLRTAYGMYLHGKNVRDEHLMQQAANVLNLALLAPQKNGIAPSIFYMDSVGGHWVADQAWGGISKGEYYAMFANAWTNYWLLQWIDLMPERKGEILKFSSVFADFLLNNQKESGVIPSWYDPETLKPAPQLRDENAETAGAAFFLAELYSRTKEQRYRASAEKAMRYIFKEIVPAKKWFDNETFFSCSRKPLDFFDQFTQQYPQNTLSMHQAAEACFLLYRLTGKGEYKDKGIEIMDYLCLYQQVWSPQWLSCELFGGFGVQNTDGEWSDSRQGYFAVTLMNYYELTGKREYFERSVAALRAMFSLFESPDSPRTAENYAHSGLDKLAGVTGIHWGTGSSVVSIHLIAQKYGDAYVNVQGQWGVGIDGCRIPSVTIKGSTINVSLLDNVSMPRAVKVKFNKLSKTSYEIVINNTSLGKHGSKELQEGIYVAL